MKTISHAVVEKARKTFAMQSENSVTLLSERAGISSHERAAECKIKHYKIQHSKNFLPHFSLKNLQVKSTLKSDVSDPRFEVCLGDSRFPEGRFGIVLTGSGRSGVGSKGLGNDMSVPAFCRSLFPPIHVSRSSAEVFSAGLISADARKKPFLSECNFSDLLLKAFFADLYFPTLETSCFSPIPVSRPSDDMLCPRKHTNRPSENMPLPSNPSGGRSEKMPYTPTHINQASEELYYSKKHSRRLSESLFVVQRDIKKQLK